MKLEKSFEKVKLINLKNPPSLIRAISIELIEDHLEMGRDVIRFVPPRLASMPESKVTIPMRLFDSGEGRILMVLKTLRVKTNSIAIF